MNANDTTIPTPPDPTAQTPTPAAGTDAPPVNPAPVLSPQEQIDAEAEAEMKAELKRLLGKAQGAETATEDGGDAGVPKVETPEAIAGAPETTPPASTEDPTQDPKDKARLDAERAAFGKLGGRISQLEAKIAERDAKLAELEKRFSAQPEPTAEPAATPAATATPPADGFDVNAEITDEERKVILGKNWEEEWGKEGGDEEIMRRRNAYAFYRERDSRDAKKMVRAELDAEREAARRNAAIDNFIADLDRAVPAAAQLDKESKTNGFDAYLDGYAPGSLTTRRQTLNAAFKAIQRGDVAQEEYARALDVAKSIYQSFATPSPQPDGLKRAEAIDPAKLAMPRISGGTSIVPAAAQAGKSYTEAEVSAALDRAAESTDPSLYDKVQEWARKLYMAGLVKKA